MSDTATRELLIEIGTEELPPKALQSLASAFAAGVVAGLDAAGLGHGGHAIYATPRRLACVIRDVPATQPDRQQERRGPALAAAYDGDGKPSRALQGFARSCGVEISELHTQQTDKGSWLVHVATLPGAATTTLLPAIVEASLAGLPIPKRMRWGSRSEEFVRPAHWVVMLFGDETVAGEVMGMPIGRSTRGHRFHHPEPIAVLSPASYADQLRDPGRVMVDFAQRRDAIRTQAAAAASRVGGQASIPDGLLDEVTGLVEWPVAVVGSFDQRFLAVPQEPLITTMQDNQKYFPVLDGAGKLLPHFITIANIESHDPAKVVAGNERVIRPRFADAEFFWEQDRKQPLATHLQALDAVVFHKRLGSIGAKSARVARLAVYIANALGVDTALCQRAATLAKCDLLSHMVLEFPELQGTMGRYYAEHDGEPAAVASALEEQYLPRYAGDRLPATDVGQVLALAERIDTLVGIFAVGQGPTGAKDPYALRRAAIGVLRLIIEPALSLDLCDLLGRAAENYPEALKADTVTETVYEFLMDRLRSYALEAGVRPDTFDAVLACRPTRPLDFHKRLQALTAFRELPAADSLAAANKRIRNLLKKVDGTVPFAVRTELLLEASEQQLAAALAELSSEVVPMFATGLYGEALERLAGLREPVDAFFDQVMVMSEDAALRDNRLALLNEMESLFLRVADLSRLQS